MTVSVDRDSVFAEDKIKNIYKYYAAMRFASSSYRSKCELILFEKIAAVITVDDSALYRAITQ